MSNLEALPVEILVSNTFTFGDYCEHPLERERVTRWRTGAGAGMNHPFMTAMAAELAKRHFATLRYLFPSEESYRLHRDDGGISGILQIPGQ